MTANRSILKSCTILLFVGAQTSWAAVDNIPNSNIVCATAPQPLPGVDVSVYQAKTNWATVAGSGVSFTFVKATEGRGAKNTAFAQEWPAAQAAGLVRSAYHYFVPTDDPHLQATFFLNTVGELSDTDLPPMIDLEVTNGMSAASIIANAQAWLDDVEAATGRIPIVYTNASFFNQLGNPAGFDRYPLYVSDYDVTCPKVPLPWKNWTFWQHSGSGATSGIPGQVDLDIFNGTIDNLGTFITNDVPVSAATTQ